MAEALLIDEEAEVDRGASRRLVEVKDEPSQRMTHMGPGPWRLIPVPDTRVKCNDLRSIFSQDYMSF